MVTITIDGTDYQVEEGGNLLQACLTLGLDLPYFCWHPAMGSVGACRQCAVVQYQNAEDERGRIVMGCMTPVTEGAIFSLSGDRAQAFRSAIVESLMLNHPHDCPVCAEGGECHLQDMTVMVGHRDRHYRGRKNTHRNQYLGPLINHEMNRCITCYRCTRFYRDYAGGTDLAALAAHDHVYFGRHQDGVLQNPFAGNLVEVCPTGVFTDKSLVHDYTRKWDLQSAPSVCVGCGVGCNTLPGERYGRLKRIHNRYNHEVNGYFLCDRGRFGGDFVNADTRLDYPAQRQPDGSFHAVHSAEARTRIIDACRGRRLAAVGSPRAGVEANVLLRQLVGADNFCSGMADSEDTLVRRIIAHLNTTPALNPSLAAMESADAVLILGEDLTHSAPRVALTLRQAVRNEAYANAAKLGLQPWQDAAVRNLAQTERNPLHIVASWRTDLADVAASNITVDIDGAVERAGLLAAVLAGGATGDSELDRIARDLAGAERPLVICGTSSNSPALIDQAAAIAAQLSSAGRQAMLSYVLPEANSMGLGLLVSGGSVSFAELIERVRRGDVDGLLVLENDLDRRIGTALRRELLEGVDVSVGLDCIEQPTLDTCGWVLPATAFTETEATLVSSEGRAQRAFPVMMPSAERRADWQWLCDLGRELRPDAQWPEHFDGVTALCAEHQAVFEGLPMAAPDHDFRLRGLKVPRQTHRYSGRTAMNAAVSVHEPRQPRDEESPLAYTMEGAAGTKPGAVLPYVWAPGWNSNQSLHKFQSEVGGALKGGSAGVRLLDQRAGAAPVAQAFASDQSSTPSGNWRLLARPRIFGSDELSALSPAIVELAGSPRLELHTEDATGLGVRDGDGVDVDGTVLEVFIDDSLPPGCATFSPGYPETAGWQSGSTAVLSKASDWVRRRPDLIGTDGEGSR